LSYESAAQRIFKPGALMADPYPLMTLEYAMAALKVRFGTDNVMLAERQITIKVHDSGREGLTPVILTVEQAKFLTANPISNEDLREERYPADWPGSAERSKRLPPGRAAHSGAVPLPFGTPKD
jgi:hypothetical protein